MKSTLYSNQNIFIFPLNQANNLKIKIIQNFNFTCSFYGMEAWTLTSGQTISTGGTESRMLRRIFGTDREDGKGVGENKRVMKRFIIQFVT
jgi:hypothetical protein